MEETRQKMKLCGTAKKKNRRQEFTQRSETLLATLRRSGHAATLSQLPKIKVGQ